MFVIGFDAIQIHLDELAACNLPRSVGTMPIVEDPKLSPCLPISSLCQYSQQRPIRKLLGFNLVSLLYLRWNMKPWTS